MSRWATQRPDTAPEARPQARRPAGPSDALDRRPHDADASEAERGGGVLVEVPIAARDEWAAIVDHGVHRAAADPEGDAGAAGQRPVGHAIEGMESARRGAGVAVPRCDALRERGHAARVSPRAGVAAVPAERDTQPALAAPSGPHGQ